MSTRKIITDLDVPGFQTLFKNIGNNIIILKFTATWCKPCNKIKPLVDEWFKKLPVNIVIVELDIDDTVDLYASLKTKKMVNGIPVLLAYYEPSTREAAHWFIPSDSVTGVDNMKVNDFFNRIQIKAAIM
jgi:thiol-disulfide isomerase/thioredoxin|tara:strand:+ start:39 stop:428 length:390 start_codon:yes stop_codon:yes gene_type:complete